MNEDPTRELLERRSFEERVFARFDSLDTLIHIRIDSLDARLQSLEEQVERRALDTKPIWERALAEIVEVKAELRTGFGDVRTELGEVKERVGALEGATRLMGRKLDILNRDLTTLRAEQLGLEDRVEKLEPSSV